MAKRLKNDTLVNVVCLGQTIAASAYYTIQQFEETAFRDNADIEALIDSGDLIFNDGTTDITDTTRAKALLNANDAASINSKIVKNTEPSDGNVLQFNNITKEFEPKNIAKNVDGGAASSVYLVTQNIDGMGA